VASQSLPAVIASAQRLKQVGLSGLTALLLRTANPENLRVT